MSPTPFAMAMMGVSRRRARYWGWIEPEMFPNRSTELVRPGDISSPVYRRHPLAGKPWHNLKPETVEW